MDFQPDMIRISELLLQVEGISVLRAGVYQIQKSADTGDFSINGYGCKLADIPEISGYQDVFQLIPSADNQRYGCKSADTISG